MISRLLLMGVICIITMTKVFAETCNIYFPDVVQGHATNSTIGFSAQGRIMNPINTELAFDILDNQSNNGNEICSVNGREVACTISGVPAPSFILPDFQTTTEGDSPTYPNNGNYSQSVEITVSDIQTLTAQRGSNLTFLSENSPYKINSASFLEQSEVTLQSGIYWFNELTISANAKVNIEGPVTLYVNGDLVIEDQGELNYDNGNGLASDLAIVNWSTVSMTDNAKVSASLYGNNVEMTMQAQLTGAISVEAKLAVLNNAKVYYEDVTDVLIGNGCSNQPIAELRFDEIQYNDEADEVIDSIGNFHGQAKSAQPVEGMVCNAVDLSDTGTEDYVILDNGILDNKTDFTISLWTKTAKTSTQSFISGATSGSFNELIMWFTSNTGFQPHLQNRHNGTLNIDSIAGDTWHHLVWTRSGTQSCLFVDNALQGRITQSADILEIDSLILGQEQDSVGGRFVASQAFNGLIDELLIFDSAISADQVSEIYKNQSNGLGYDGSVRTCPIPETLAPLAEYRFEEDNWNGSNNQILDSSGNGFHGTP
ncbi:LamG domain-containing protein [Psychromonas sp. KJ10-10]|uniref:LamG domain-containing protein n=1 Tax=Psychromonas sp. KJ10-10 TaxID=3391823 RepID=UPI0039B453AB